MTIKARVYSDGRHRISVGALRARRQIVRSTIVAMIAAAQVSLNERGRPVPASSSTNDQEDDVSRGGDPSVPAEQFVRQISIAASRSLIFVSSTSRTLRARAAG